MSLRSLFKIDRSRPEVLFLISAFLLLTIFIVSIILTLKFLVMRFNWALDVKRAQLSVEVVKFDLEGFNNLKFNR